MIIKSLDDSSILGYMWVHKDYSLVSGTWYLPIYIHLLLDSSGRGIPQGHGLMHCMHCTWVQKLDSHKLVSVALRLLTCMLRLQFWPLQSEKSEFGAFLLSKVSISQVF